MPKRACFFLLAVAMFLVGGTLIATGTAVAKSDDSPDPNGHETVTGDTGAKEILDVEITYGVGTKRSSNPIMFTPEELLEYEPISPPDSWGDESTDVSNESMVLFNLETGIEILLPYDHPSQLPIGDGAFQDEPFFGALGPPPAIDSVIPPEDDREVVHSTESYPWRTIAKLHVDFPDGSGGGCTGFFVDEFHILTAGHCVFDHADGQGWATSITVIPGQDGEYDPYYRAYATQLRSYTGWTEDGNVYHDWGMVTLDRNVGAFVGWMGRYTTTDMPYYEGGFNSAGYPGDLDDGIYLYRDYDTGTLGTEYEHYYQIDTGHGQSGMPIYKLSDGNRYVTTVHTQGIRVYVANSGTRLNQDKFDRVNTWRTSDTPPTDYPDMIDEGPDDSGFYPDTVVRGETAFHAFCAVRNIGTASAGGFYVDLYASWNDIISPIDHLLGRVRVSGMAPFDWVVITANFTFPSSVPAGDYYIGAVIDGDEEVDERSEGNNDAVFGWWNMVTVLDPTWDISGYVRDGGTPVAGVTLAGLPGDPTTDADGFYIATVDHNWDGDVIPAKNCLEFTPYGRAYTNVNVDLTNQNYEANDLDCSAWHDQCNNGQCAPSTGQCFSAPKPNGTGCNDDLFCTVDDQCTSGNCVGSARDCSGVSDQCNDPLCNEGTNQCEPAPKPDGTVCDDEQFCTVDDQCAGGSCAGGSRDCSELDDQCHDGECDETADVCEPVPKETGTACDDGRFCTVEDRCEAGDCSGVDRDCNDDLFCTGEETCDEIADSCESAGDPCAETETCDEVDDLCLAASDDDDTTSDDDTIGDDDDNDDDDDDVATGDADDDDDNDGCGG
jgi:V8-like Glu-specific endopeptidase